MRLARSHQPDFPVLVSAQLRLPVQRHADLERVFLLPPGAFPTRAAVARDTARRRIPSATSRKLAHTPRHRSAPANALRTGSPLGGTASAAKRDPQVPLRSAQLATAATDRALRHRSSWTVDARDIRTTHRSFAYLVFFRKGIRVDRGSDQQDPSREY